VKELEGHTNLTARNRKSRSQLNMSGYDYRVKVWKLQFLVIRNKKMGDYLLTLTRNGSLETTTSEIDNPSKLIPQSHPLDLRQLMAEDHGPYQ
jgi:hypothetical protein